MPSHLTALFTKEDILLNDTDIHIFTAIYIYTNTSKSISEIRINGFAKNEQCLQKMSRVAY